MSHTLSSETAQNARAPEAALASRRHAQTRAEIHRAAIQLAMAHPVADITVEQIARAAGISRRTFFNYFPAKDDAFIPAVAEIPVEAAQRFVDPARFSPCPDDAPSSTQQSDLLAAAAELLRARAKCLEPTLAEHRQLVDVKRNNPELQPLFMKAVREFELALRHLAAERLDLLEDDPRVIAVACLMSSIEKSALDVWLRGRRSESFETVLVTVIAGLRAILGLPKETEAAWKPDPELAGPGVMEIGELTTSIGHGESPTSRDSTEPAASKASRDSVEPAQSGRKA